MGLVASQARLLMSFARKSDLEYRCQVISNRRMRLAFETGEVAKVYADALSNVTPSMGGNVFTPIAATPQAPVQTTNTTSNSTSALNSITIQELISANLMPYMVANNEVASGLMPDKLAEGLNDGTVYLKYLNAPAGTDPNTQLQWGGGTTTVTTTSNVDQYQTADVTTNTNWPTPPEQPPALQQVDRLYTEDDASATAIYEAQTAILQAEDKRLEMELKNMETLHKAVSTEIDAIQKVIDKNIEKSFKTLG